MLLRACRNNVEYSLLSCLNLFLTVFIKFIIVGGLTFLIYYFFLWIFFDFFGMTSWMCIAGAYFIAVTFHFLTNKNITFKSREFFSFRHLIRYAALSFFNYFVQLFAVQICTLYFDLNFYSSVLIGIILTMGLGYFFMRGWVFKD